MEEKRTSAEWQRLHPEIKILDPDGWHRDERFEYEWNEELITYETYQERLWWSTCIPTKLKNDGN